MTANELADINEWSCCAHSKQVSAMLRQQAQEIEALNNAVDSLVLNNVLWELTDEEILALWVKKNNLNGAKDILDFARDLLKKSSEKYCNKCNNTGWVCECHPDKEAHKCCGGAGMPCECTKESE